MRRSEHRYGQGRFDDARPLHDRNQGGYTFDSYYNQYEGAYGNEDYNNMGGYVNQDYQHNNFTENYYRPGGAQYTGHDYTGNRSSARNPFGMTFMPDDDYNSGRHYDSRADYGNTRYDSDRGSRDFGYHRRGDEIFGHDISRRGQEDFYHNQRQMDYESDHRYNRPHNRYRTEGVYRNYDSNEAFERAGSGATLRPGSNREQERSDMQRYGDMGGYSRGR